MGSRIHLIDLGDGNDIFNGGKHSEKVIDGQGVDTYKLGAGNDLFAPVPESGASGDDNVARWPGHRRFLPDFKRCSHDYQFG